MSSTFTDVLVVGAGPAGLATAIGLARRGTDFRIVDALPEAQNTSRAAVIHAATLESLRELQVADLLIAQGIKVPHFRIRDRDSILLNVAFDGLSSPTPFALMIPQDESERILIDRLSGLRDAAALAEALAQAIETGSDAPLDGYAATRRTTAADVLAMTDRLTRVATIAHAVMRWIRNRLIGAAGSFPRVRRYAANTLAGFN